MNKKIVIFFLTLNLINIFSDEPSDTNSNKQDDNLQIARNGKIINSSTYEDEFSKIFDDPILNSKKISIKSGSAKVQDLIDVIGNSVGISFVIDPKVNGKIGKISFNHIQPGHILRFLCQNHEPSLTILKDKDVWWVITQQDALQKREKEVIHKVFDLHYINPTDKFKDLIEKTWNNIVTAKEKLNSYMSIDTERKRIFCKASLKTIEEFKEFLNHIDRQVTKIKIDAIIVFAEKNFNFDFGINWSGIYNRLDTIKLKHKAFDFIGLGGILTDFPTPTSSIFPHNANLLVNPENFAINLFTKSCRNSRIHHSGSDQTIKVPFVFGGRDLNVRRLNLVLHAAEIESKAKIISRPSVMTNDNEVAKILVGESLPMQTGRIEELSLAVPVGGIDFPTVSYKDIGISLEVHPIASPDKSKIKLEIFLEESEVIKGNTQTNEKGVMQDPPVINVVKIHNKVTLNDGQTVIIGGLSTYDERKSVNRVPWLYRLPVIGPFFTGTTECKREFEQFIFITPSIINDDYCDDCECKI